MKFYKNCKVWALINLVLSWGFPFGRVWLNQIIQSVWISQSVETNQTIRMNQFYPVLEKFPAGQLPPVNFPRSNSPQVSNCPPVNYHLAKFSPGKLTPRWISIWSNYLTLTLTQPLILTLTQVGIHLETIYRWEFGQVIIHRG